MKKKGLMIALALIMALGVGAGATLAYLFVQTEPVVNTFEYGDINITLDESDADGDKNTKKNDYKMVPGNKIAKDPRVVVETGSEDCYLFIKIEKSSNYSTYLEDYKLADGWNSLGGVEGVYYREAAAGDSFYVLANGGDEYANGYVEVKTTVTNSDMAAIKESGMPTLTFTAYAVQKANIGTAADAWAIAQNNGLPTN